MRPGRSGLANGLRKGLEIPEAEILKPFGEFKTPGRQEEVAKMLRRLADEADRGEWARLIGSLALLQHIMMKNWGA
jgi:hypothetical protein